MIIEEDGLVSSGDAASDFPPLRVRRRATITLPAVDVFAYYFDEVLSAYRQYPQQVPTARLERRRRSRSRLASNFLDAPIAKSNSNLFSFLVPTRSAGPAERNCSTLTNFGLNLVAMRHQLDGGMAQIIVSRH